MVVTQSNKVYSTPTNKIIINDKINMFLGTVSNLWSNPLNWSLGILPTSNHTAIITVNCLLNTPASVRNLVLYPGIVLDYNINMSLYTITLYNEGIINCNMTNTYLTVYGMNDSLFGGINFSDKGSMILDAYEKTAIIPDLDYNNLTIGVSAPQFFQQAERVGFVQPKYFNTENVTIRGGLGINRSVVINSKNFIVNGGISINYLPEANAGQKNVGTLYILNTGTTFTTKGLFYKNLYSSMDFSGNPKVEIGGGISGIGWGYTHVHNVGTGIWEFKTNNQIASSNSGQNGYNTIYNGLINDITFIIGLGYYFNPGTMITKINGTTPTSTLKMDIDGYLLLQHVNSVDIMDVGIFDAETEPNVVTYSLNGNQDIIKTKNSKYSELRIENSGVKLLHENTTCEHLYFNGTATLAFNGFTLTGYSKYTDMSYINRTIPGGTYTAVNILGGGTKILTNNVNTDVFNYNYGVVVNLNSFILNSPIINIDVNMSAGNLPLLPYDHNRITFVYLGGGGGSHRISLSRNTNVNEMRLRGNKDHSTVFQIDESTYSIICYNWFYDGPEHQWIWIRTYVNLSLTGQTKYLLGDIIVTGIYYRHPSTSIIKNGYTIKNAAGVELD